MMKRYPLKPIKVNIVLNIKAVLLFNKINET